MAEKNMTQVQALEIAVAEMTNEEARGIIEGMIEKRKAPRKPRVNKEAEAFRAALVTFMSEADGPLTNAEIAAHFEVKPQKVANNIRVLENGGIVERIRGEKASDKDTFVLC
jgi:DNA-binding GntR family transcriptional regulator